MPINLFYTMVQKVKNDQKLKSRGGPALRSKLCCFPNDEVTRLKPCSFFTEFINRPLSWRRDSIFPASLTSCFSVPSPPGRTKTRYCRGYGPWTTVRSTSLPTIWQLGSMVSIVWRMIASYHEREKFAQLGRDRGGGGGGERERGRGINKEKKKVNEREGQGAGGAGGGEEKFTERKRGGETKRRERYKTLSGGGLQTSFA